MQSSLLTAMLAAPFKGLNKRDPLLNMEPEYATTLENMIPDVGECKLRGGYSRFYDCPSTISSLFAMTTAAGTEKMAITITGDVYDISSGSGSSVKGTATLSGDWSREACMFRHNIVWGGNSSNNPFHWSGTGNVVETTWTGVTLTLLRSPFTYKNRIYYCENGSARVWYGGVDTLAVASTALTSFDFQSLLSRGGYIMFGGLISRASGYLAEELFFVCSQNGEILIYSGSYPGDSSWTIVARLFIPKPLSRRAFFYVFGDCYIITELGVYSVLTALETGQQRQSNVTDAIQSEWMTVTQSNGSGAAGIFVPELNLILASQGSSGAVYAQNFLTKAWTKFTGFTTLYQFALYDGSLYWIYVNDIWKYLPTTFTDSNSAISWKVKHASTDLGNKVIKKVLRQMMPVIKPSADALLVSAIAHMDFNVQAQSAVHTLVGNGNWNVNWMGVQGLGRNLQFELSGQTTSNLSYLATYLAFQNGDLF